MYFVALGRSAGVNLTLVILSFMAVSFYDSRMIFRGRIIQLLSQISLGALRGLCCMPVAHS